MGCAWPYSASVEIEGNLLLIAVQNLFKVSMCKEYMSLEEWMCRLASQFFNPKFNRYNVSMRA